MFCFYFIKDQLCDYKPINRKNACVRSTMFDYVFRNFKNSTVHFLEKALEYTSSLLSFYGGMLILYNKNLQSHPYKAYAYMMIVDAGNMLQFNLAQDIWRTNEIIDIPNIRIL